MSPTVADRDMRAREVRLRGLMLVLIVVWSSGIVWPVHLWGGATVLVAILGASAGYLLAGGLAPRRASTARKPRPAAGLGGD
jgi:hypothetical protein